MVKKAITYLRLALANAGKLKKLDLVAEDYRVLLQHYCDYLVVRGEKEPDKFQLLPEDTETKLSARWQRCCWQQACGTVESWFSNDRENEPEIKNLVIQGNANVVVLEKSRTDSFDYWLRISTLERGKVIRVPLKLYRHAREVLTQYPEQICSGVLLKRDKHGNWFCTLVVNAGLTKVDELARPKLTEIVGVDVGMAWIATTSEGQHYGNITDQLVKKIDKKAKRFQRKQKLNSCLERKSLPKVDLHDHKAEAFCRNEIGKALNRLVQDLPENVSVAVENLNVETMRFKSRAMNRRLRTSQLGYIRDKLQYKLEEHGFVWEAVNPAYTSQRCSCCGYVSRENRKTQAKFSCEFCWYEDNADVNGACSIAERFGDRELRGLDFRKVKPILDRRFQARFPGGCSPPAGLDSNRETGMPTQPS